MTAFSVPDDEPHPFLAEMGFSLQKFQWNSPFKEAPKMRFPAATEPFLSSNFLGLSEEILAFLATK